MSIIKKPGKFSEPEWRQVLDNPSQYPESTVKAARKEAGKLSKEYRDNFSSYLEEQRFVSNLTKSGPSEEARKAYLEARKQFGTQLGNVKDDIRKAYEESKDNLMNQYEEKRDELARQFDDAKRKAQEAKKEAQKVYNTAKEAFTKFKNGGFKESFKALSNGFSEFMKQDMGDILDSFSPLFGSVLNRLSKKFFESLEKRLGVKFPTKFAMSQYNLYCDIGGVLVNNVPGATLTYREIVDYWNADFPIRILEVSAPHTLAQKIIRAKRQIIGDTKTLVEITMGALPSTVDSYQGSPTLLGKFLGLIKESDTAHSLQEEISSGTHAQKQDMIPPVKFTIYLYRENELSFQSVKDVNLMLTNPKPSEIIMKAFTMTENKDARILYSTIENDVAMGQVLLTNKTLMEVINYVDNEVGLFRTPAITFFENGLFYLLNSDDANNINASLEALETTIWLYVIRGGDSGVYPVYIEKKAKRTWFISVPVTAVSITRDNSTIFNDDVTYISPSGKRYDHKYDVSRNTKIRRLSTETNPLVKEGSTIYEWISIDQEGIPIDKWSPLSKIFVQDAAGEVRIYRVSHKEVHIESGGTMRTVLKGFRKVAK